MREYCTVILSPSAQVLVRGNNALQFGLDATQAGICEVEKPFRAARALQSARRAVDLSTLENRLVDAGMSTVFAREFLEDLMTYGVLQPVSNSSVTLLGETPLAILLRELLVALGITVRIPLPHETPLDILADYSTNRPVVLVDRLATDIELGSMLLLKHRTSLSVALVDGRGLIGPTRINGAGPCPMCVELHWVKRDPYFHTVARQAIRTQALMRQDPAATYATAAAAAVHVQRLCGRRFGLAPTTVQPGDCTVVDVYHPERSHVFTLERDRGCPVCFAAEGVAVA